VAHEETIYGLMKNGLNPVDKHILGDVMASKGVWSAGTSASNNADKILKSDSRLEKIDGYYRIIGCKSEYKEHSRLLTKAIAEIHKLNYEVKVYREKTISSIGLRPDAIVLLTKNNQHLCFILEVCNNEFPEFLQQKVNAWRQWENALHALSEFLEMRIQAFDIVVSGDISAEGTFEFNQYLKDIQEVKK
jgi:hypothetical protein